jgi:NADH:ubiquinone oxidoreductase subunit E
MTPADPRVGRGARGSRPAQPGVPVAAPTEDERAAVDSVLARYPGFQRDQLLSVLHEVRATGHWFSEELTRYLAQRLGIPFADLHGIISFYGLFQTVPSGRVVLRVCKGLPCYLHGAAQLGEHLQSLLEVGPGQPTPDGALSWEWFDCLGQCEFAPALLVDEEAVRGVTPEVLERIVREMRG